MFLHAGSEGRRYYLLNGGKIVIGKRIRELRKAAKLTQQELGEHLGVSASAVGMYEQDRRTPDMETLSMLCTMFDITADYLLFGKGSSKPEPMSAEKFLNGLKRQVEKQKGLLYEELPGNRHRVFSAAEMDKLNDAIRIGAAMALGIQTRKED